MIETERLLLRPLSLRDLDDFVALHEDPEVTRFVTRRDRPAAARWLQRNESHWLERGHGMFAVMDRATGRFLGRAGLRYWPQFGETEVGWVLRREAWGRGFASEAARACRDWGFVLFDVPYLTAMIAPANERSVGVARRLGMTPLRDDVLDGDDVVVYALTRDD